MCTLYYCVHFVGRYHMSLGHLQNSPLTQATLEVTFPGEPAVMTRLDEYFALIRHSYPALYVPNAIHGVATALQPWEFKNEPGLRSVGISVNGFSFRVQDYVDYSDFRKAALPLAQQFLDLFGIQKMNRFALQYVNNIALLRLPGQPLRLGNYLKIGIDVPSVIDSSALEDIHLQFSSRTADSQVVVNLHHQQPQPGVPECLALVLDCAIVDNVLAENLEGDLDAVHSRIEDCFAALVADTYMQFMKGDDV